MYTSTFPYTHTEIEKKKIIFFTLSKWISRKCCNDKPLNRAHLIDDDASQDEPKDEEVRIVCIARATYSTLTFIKMFTQYMHTYMHEPKYIQIKLQ